MHYKCNIEYEQEEKHTAVKDKSSKQLTSFLSKCSKVEDNLTKHFLRETSGIESAWPQCLVQTNSKGVLVQPCYI